MGKRLLTAAGFLLGFGANAGLMAENDSDYHDELLALSLGSFTSLEQAGRDDRYGVVEAEVVRIWPDRDDGHWLYQEQAFLGQTPDDIDVTAKDRPYLVRVTHSVEVEPGVVRRTPHRLKNQEAVFGAWRAEEPLSGLSPDDLEPVECSLTVTRIAENYWTSRSETCPNAHRGAAYAISLGVTHKGGYANWDRGFAEDGAHVWGPASGGYIFKIKQ